MKPMEKLHSWSGHFLDRADIELIASTQGLRFRPWTIPKMIHRGNEKNRRWMSAMWESTPRHVLEKGKNPLVTRTAGVEISYRDLLSERDFLMRLAEVCLKRGDQEAVIWLEKHISEAMSWDDVKLLESEYDIISQGFRICVHSPSIGSDGGWFRLKIKDGHLLPVDHQKGGAA